MLLFLFVLVRRCSCLTSSAPPAQDGSAMKGQADAFGKFEMAPPMTFTKFRTMQEKRVRLSIRYSRSDRYALQTYERIKEIVNEKFPDVLVANDVRGVRSSRDAGIFELVVDGRVVYSKPTERQGIYLSMKALSSAIVRARRIRRPGTAYGEEITESLYFNQPY